MTELSIVIIAKNEQGRIGACLESCRFADEIIVVDSYSTDGTARIAEGYGAKVILRRFENFSDQKNYAMAQATRPWIFSIDADEVIPSRLREEIVRQIQDPQALDGYFVPRDNQFFGRCLRHGGQQDDKQMRLFRAGKAHFYNVVHEQVAVAGSTGVLRERLLHNSCRGLDDYFRKFTQYTDLEVFRLREQGISFHWSQLLIRPWARFAYTYLWKGGFLDGAEGFLFHFLSAFYTFVKYAKLRELSR